MAIASAYITISDVNDGNPGAAGIRGAGRWNYRVGTAIDPDGYSQDQVNAFLRNALIAAGVPQGQTGPVAADQMWLFASDTPEDLTVRDQIVYIYDGILWQFQREVINGNLLVSDSITAEKFSARSIQGLGLTIGTLSSTPTGARLVISDNRLQVIDESNVVRVTIGDLS